MGLKLVTSAEPLVDLDEVKQWCRVDDDDDQDLVLNILIAAAEEAVAKITNRAFREAVWDLFLDEFPDCPIQLPIAPLISIDSVKYYDELNVLTTFPSADYDADLNSEPAKIIVGDEGWPETFDRMNGVVIRFTAGYEGETDSESDAPDRVPRSLKAAVLMLISHWYENREPVNIGSITSQIPLTLETLIAMHRMYV